MVGGGAPAPPTTDNVSHDPVSWLLLTTQYVPPFNHFLLGFPATRDSTSPDSALKVALRTIAAVVIHLTAHCCASLLKHVAHAFFLPIQLVDQSPEG